MTIVLLDAAAKAQSAALQLMGWHGRQQTIGAPCGHQRQDGAQGLIATARRKGSALRLRVVQVSLPDAIARAVRDLGRASPALRLDQGCCLKSGEGLAIGGADKLAGVEGCKGLHEAAGKKIKVGHGCLRSDG